MTEGAAIRLRKARAGTSERNDNAALTSLNYVRAALVYGKHWPLQENSHTTVSTRS
jgi:hypothetical protein